MPATRDTAARGKGKLLITAFLLVGLMVGLAACRGFFGQAPIALLTYTPITDEEVPVTVDFDISGSNDPDGNIATYDVDYGDTSTHATGTDVTDDLSHPYTVAGTFTVTLTVTDGDGRIGMDTATVIIGPAMITFASDRSGNYGIYRMLADGTGETEVRNTADDELFPDLIKGTRDKIAYAAEESVWNIWSMTVEGDALAQLTTQTASNQIQPSWSYNATKIAYASDETGNWEIYTMTANGGSQAKLTTQSPSWAIAPAYSPVSNDLLFVSDLNNTGSPQGTAIWKLHGTTATQLYPATTTHTYHYGDASPDMSAAFATALDLPTGAGISRPAWSPDGTKIAFSTDKNTAINIYVMNADGTGAQTLEAYVNSLLSSSVTASSITSADDEFSPYWLEDETGLVFVREETTGYNIYKVSFDDGSVTSLTDTTDTDIMPAARR